MRGLKATKYNCKYTNMVGKDIDKKSDCTAIRMPMFLP